MKTLGKILGTETRVKAMRLFLFNPDRGWLFDEIVDRTRSAKSEVKKEIELLLKAGVIKKVVVLKDKGVDRVKVRGFGLRQEFPYLAEFQQLLVDTLLISDKDLIERISLAGRPRLIIAAGIFIKNWDSRVDLFIVGEKLKEDVLLRVINKIESEVGRELKYATLNTADFQYRLGVGDKLVRDVLDFPHKIIIDRFGM